MEDFGDDPMGPPPHHANQPPPGAAADQVEGVFRELAEQMRNVVSTLSAQGVSQIVPNFNGDPKMFRDWATALDKYAQLANLDDNNRKLTALQMSSGCVSGHIKRWMCAFPNGRWDILRRDLASRFSDVANRSLPWPCYGESNKTMVRALHLMQNEFCLWRKRLLAARRIARSIAN